ncbi:MAG: peptide deformylase [Mariprofundaceae bacterium]|nr:peptide deformylase [Mariprofundaceae bacterium]
MSIQRILIYPEDCLKKVAQPIQDFGTDDLKTLVQDLLDSMYDAPGVGLAAPQIGVSLRVAVTDVNWRSEGAEKQHQVWINPEFLWKSEKTEITEEGCLSLPDMYADIERPSALRLRWFDVVGNVFEEDFEGFQAVALQHEFDHLDGKVFIDYVSALKRRMMVKKLKKKYFS